jgi:hypothetical protein
MQILSKEQKIQGIKGRKTLYLEGIRHPNEDASQMRFHCKVDSTENKIALRKVHEARNLCVLAKKLEH